jgi:hypothetical protein
MMLDSIREIVRLLMGLHPELQNDQIMGLLHIDQTKAEFNLDSLKEEAERIKKTIASLPDIPSDPPAPPTSPG